MDVKSTFLNGDLKEEVYVRKLPGYAITGEEEKVYRLCKALYGLCQAQRLERKARCHTQEDGLQAKHT